VAVQLDAGRLTRDVASRYDVPDVDDEADFSSLLQAFEEMGISPEETEWVMELVAGVLCIGNTTFVSDGGEGGFRGGRGSGNSAADALASNANATQVPA
jgi:myosin heavy subunit